MLTCRNAICDDKLLWQSSGEIEYRFQSEKHCGGISRVNLELWASDFYDLSIFQYFRGLVRLMAFVAGIFEFPVFPWFTSFFLIPGGLQFGRCRGSGLWGEFSTEMVVSAQGKALPISHHVVVSNMFSCSSLPGEMIFNWVETTK